MAAQDRHHKKYSFEFFPPRSAETEEKLVHTRQQLAALLPDFFSVTFGAGGRTRDKTLETVLAVDLGDRGLCTDESRRSSRDGHAWERGILSVIHDTRQTALILGGCGRYKGEAQQRCQRQMSETGHN